MSTVYANELRGPSQNNHNINMAYGNWAKCGTGQVLQTVWRRMEAPLTFTAPAASTTVLDGLQATITKKDPNSYCYIQWWVFYETHHDVTFKAMRDNSVIGYNTEIGNTPYSGIGTAEYEHSFDNASTPSVLHLAYWDRNISAAAMTYQLGVQCSSGTSYTVRLNSSQNYATDSYERGVSWVMIEEISYF